jgi:hypothetical protein
MKTNYFKLIFCKLYHWIKYLNVDDIPQYTTLSIYSILVFFNVMSVVGFIRYVIKGDAFFKVPLVYILILYLAVTAVLYLYFIRNKKYIEFYKTYSKTILSKPFSSVLTAMYIVISVLLFIFVMVIL